MKGFNTICVFIVVSLFCRITAVAGVSMDAVSFNYKKSNDFFFIENKGQLITPDGLPASDVLFKYEQNGLIIYVTNKGLSYFFYNVDSSTINGPSSNKQVLHEIGSPISWSRVDLYLKGSSVAEERVKKLSPCKDYINYFYPQCDTGLVNVKIFKRIEILNVYKNIDWFIYVDENNQIKYDFLVHPGGDVSEISLLYKGAANFFVNNLSLTIITKQGKLIEGDLLVYDKESSQTIEAGYIVRSRNIIPLNEMNFLQCNELELGFALHTNNKLKGSIVIDPPLIWCTKFGDTQEEAKSIKCDGLGNVLVGGYTYSTNFPVMNSGSYFQGTLSSSFKYDGFLLKFNNAGTLLWSTYYGGTQYDYIYSICIDGNNNIYAFGNTGSSNFPVQNSGAFYQPTNAGMDDLFLLKFDNNGNRLWSTYYGGAHNDYAININCDHNNNIVCTGYTTSVNFPLLNSGGYFQSTYVGNQDMFTIKFNSSGTRLWSTYMGGTAQDEGRAIAFDSNNNMFLVGYTQSADFPLLNGGGFYQSLKAGTTGDNDMFITKFDAADNLKWSTYYGGSDEDYGTSVVCDNNNNLYVGGITLSTDLSMHSLSGAYNQASKSTGWDMFLSKFDNSGGRLWATYYGGNGFDQSDYFNTLAADRCNNIYFLFTTNSTNIAAPPCDNNYFDASVSSTGNLYLARFSPKGAKNWGTYIGGSRYDHASSIDINSQSDIFFVGRIFSYTTADLSTLPLQNPGGGAYFNNVSAGSSSANFIIGKFENKLSVSASLQPTSCTSCTGVASLSVTGGCIPYNYFWNTASTTNAISFLCAGTYTASVIDSISCATGSVSATISIPSGPVITIDSIKNVYCNGEANGYISVSASGANSPFTYSWQALGSTAQVLSSLAAGTYTVVVKDINGCENDTVINIAEPVPLSLIINASDTIVCAGANVLLSGQAIGGTPGYSFLWGNSATNSSININPTQDTTYVLTVTDTNGCTSVTSKTIAVWQLSSIYVDSVTICLGDTAMLIANGSAVSYYWINQGVTSTSVNVSPKVNTVYSVIATDINGCTTQASGIVNVKQPPPVTVTPDTTIVKGNGLVLSAGSTSSVSYVWSPVGSLACSTCSSNYFIPDSSGIYIVKVTNVYGCSILDTVQIIVVDKKIPNCINELYIPNAFSPNDDGNNDVFRIENKTFLKVQWCVLNRWGEVVIKADDTSIGWNGEYKSQKMPTGVYVIAGIVFCKEGEELTFSKNISLIR